MILDYFKNLTSTFGFSNKPDDNDSNATHDSDLFFEPSNNENISFNDGVLFRFISFIADRFYNNDFNSSDHPDSHLDEIMAKITASAMQSADELDISGMDNLQQNFLGATPDTLSTNILMPYDAWSYNVVSNEALNHIETYTKSVIEDIHNPINQDEISDEPYISLVNNSNVIEMNNENFIPDNAISVDNDDIIWAIQNQDNPQNLEYGNIINFSALNSSFDSIENLNIANDLGNSIKLEASDILDFGNNLVITGSQLDFIELEGPGWIKLGMDTNTPDGVELKDGFDTYIHDSGAIVQIEHVIHTSYFDPSSGQQ